MNTMAKIYFAIFFAFSVGATAMVLFMCPGGPECINPPGGWVLLRICWLIAIAALVGNLASISQDLDNRPTEIEE